jgi:hypothetical protein
MQEVASYMPGLSERGPGVCSFMLSCHWVEFAVLARFNRSLFDGVEIGNWTPCVSGNCLINKAAPVEKTGAAVM